MFPSWGHGNRNMTTKCIVCGTTISVFTVTRLCSECNKDKTFNSLTGPQWEWRFLQKLQEWDEERKKKDTT